VALRRWGEQAQRLFEPDILVAEQWRERTRSAVLSPEQKLCWAVLEDAVHVMRTTAGMPGPKALALRADVLAWLHSDDETWPYALVPLAESLGLDPSWVRRGFENLEAGRRKIVIQRTGNRHTVQKPRASRRGMG
jgi:hypothetical protein